MPKNPRSFAFTLEPEAHRRADLSEEERTLVAQAIRCLEARYLVKHDCRKNSDGDEPLDASAPRER